MFPVGSCATTHDLAHFAQKHYQLEERNTITQVNNVQQSNSIEQTTTSTPTPKPQERLGVALALLTLYLIWGSTYLGMSIALKSFPPFLMSGIRFLLAGTLLYAVLRARRNPAPSRAQWGGAAVVGLLLVVGGNGGVSFAEQWVA